MSLSEFRTLAMIDMTSAIKACSGLTLPQRRKLLRTAFRAGHFTGKIKSYDLGDLLIHTLRVNRAESRKLEFEYTYHDMLQGMEWLVMSSKSHTELLRDAPCVSYADESLFKRLSAMNAPIILSPMHMGAFPVAIAATLHQYFRDRKVLILRAKEDNETNKAAMSRLAETSAGLRVLNIYNKADYVDALRYARDGAVVISFIDLPGSYGSPETTTLFNAPAQIALGIEALARIIKGCVVPMAVSSSNTGDTVKIGTPFEVSDSGVTERQQIASRIARNIEQFVYDDPAQWHLWPRLDEFRPSIVTEETENAA